VKECLMGLKIKPQSSKDFSELPPEGDHFAACVAVVDLGTHTPPKGYQGAPPESRHLVYIAWELVDLPTRPVVGKDFTASLHEKAKLRIWLKQWFGKDVAGEFDVKKLVGQKCQLTVEHTPGERAFAVITQLTKLRPDDKVKDAQHKAVSFDLDDGEDFDCPEWMPYLYGRDLGEWIDAREELTPPNPRHTERQASQPPDQEEAAMAGEDNDSIPF
jgi:hypothetical protein